MLIKPIKFDLSKFRLYEKLKAKQGDTESRFLLFQLLDGSLPFDLENRSVRAYMIKPDGNEVFNDLIINDRVKGYCTLELTNQVLAAPGIVKLELMVTEGTKKLTSSVFELEVDKSINSEKSIVSTNEFGALLKGLASLNEYDNYKNEIAEARDGEKNLLTKVKKIDEQLETMTTYVTPEMYGAVGDGIVDDTEAIQNSIDTNKKVVMKNNYKFSSIILKNDVEAIGVLEGEIIISKSNIHLNFNKIIGKVVYLSESELVQHSSIRGKQIMSTDINSVTYKSTGDFGVQYCITEVGLISSNSHCIYLEKIKGWVNNNYVVNTGFTGGCGIGSLAQNDKYDGMIFDNVGFEHIKKWFDLNNCYNFIFKNFRMMPYEAHFEGITGDLNKSNVFFETSLTGLYFQKINCVDSQYEALMPYSTDGERVADKITVKNGNVIAVTRDSKPSFYKKLSEMGGTEVLNYNYNYTKSLYINCDISKYVWFNIQIPLVINALNYIKLHIIGEPQQNIEVAVNNSLRLTIQPSNYKEEYTIFLK